MRRGFVVALALVLLAGIVYPRTTDSTTTHAVTDVEVPFGALAEGSTVGANATNASVSLVGSVLLLTTTDLVWLNNTNTSGPYYARLHVHTATGLADVLAATLGIHNGTSATPQAVVAGGVLTQATASPVRLDPGASGKIYLSQSVLGLGIDQELGIDVYLSDEANESAYTVTKLAISML